MTNLMESLRKGPVMTMTLQCETDFPRALKDNMKSLGFEREAEYLWDFKKSCTVL